MSDQPKTRPIPWDHDDDGWTVDYETLEAIADMANINGRPYRKDQVENIIMELVRRGYASMEGGEAE